MHGAICFAENYTTMNGVRFKNIKARNSNLLKEK
jgi:hypothetical protein